MNKISYNHCVFTTIPTRTRQSLRQKLNLTFRLLFMFNPIKAGGSESMYRRGGVPRPPPLEKDLSEYVYV